MQRDVWLLRAFINISVGYSWYGTGGLRFDIYIVEACRSHGALVRSGVAIPFASWFQLVIVRTFHLLVVVFMEVS